VNCQTKLIYPIDDKNISGDLLQTKQRESSVLFVYSDLSKFVLADLEMLQKHFKVRPLKVTAFLVPRKSKDWIAYFRLFKGVLCADLVYFWWADLNAFFAVLFSVLLRKKSIVVIGGYEVAYVPEINYGTLISRVGRLEVKFILNHASKVVAVSESSKKEILNFAKPRKLSLVYNGVDTERFRPAGDKERMVITVGQISRDVIDKKRLDTFVDVSNYFPKVNFVIIGRILDDSVRQLKSRASQNLEFTGYVSDQSLLRYYQKAQVYCQLSTQESFGVALAEAMSCECVPVVTKRYSLPEIVGETGFYVPYKSPEATAAAVRQALASDKGVRARERIEKYFSFNTREKKLIGEISDCFRK